MKYTQLDAIRVYREYCQENGWCWTSKAPVPQALYCIAEAAVKAERVVVLSSHAKMWEYAARKWWAKLESAMWTLSMLSSYVGAGMADADVTSPEEYDKRIRWGIDHLLRVETGRQQEVSAELVAARSELEAAKAALQKAKDMLDMDDAVAAQMVLSEAVKTKS